MNFPEIHYSKHDNILFTRPRSVCEVRENGYPERIEFCQVYRSDQAERTFHTCDLIHTKEIVIVWPKARFRTRTVDVKIST